MSDEKNRPVPVAIYNGNCGLCRRFASALRKMAPPDKLDVVPCQSAIQKKLAPHVEEECLKAFIVVETDGTILKGGDAAARAISIAPAMKRFRWMIESRLGRVAARTIYKQLSSDINTR